MTKSVVIKPEARSRYFFTPKHISLKMKFLRGQTTNSDFLVLVHIITKMDGNLTLTAPQPLYERWGQDNLCQFVNIFTDYPSRSVLLSGLVVSRQFCFACNTIILNNVTWLTALETVQGMVNWYAANLKWSKYTVVMHRTRKCCVNTVLGEWEQWTILITNAVQFLAKPKANFSTRLLESRTI